MSRSIICLPAARIIDKRREGVCAAASIFDVLPSFREGEQYFHSVRIIKRLSHSVAYYYGHVAGKQTATS